MPWWNPIIDPIALLTVLGLLAGLVFQWFSAYFSIGGFREDPDASEVSTYWVTAAITVAVCLVGLTAGLMRRNRAAIIGYFALGALVVTVIVLFSVPQADWAQIIYDIRNPVYQVNPNYCSRTDSENCPGG